MNTGTMLTILVGALIVVVLLLLIRAATNRRRTPTMRALPPESRDRYVQDWDQIETRFIDAPEEAVRQAESLVLSVLRERGHPLSDRDLPDEVRKAQRLGHGSKDRTEGMRQAMLRYRAVLERMLGPEGRTRAAGESDRRPEMA